MTSLNDLLKSKPSYDTLTHALHQWTSRAVVSKFTVQDAATARLLVSEVLPNFWPLVQDGDLILRDLLCASLASLAGVNALLSARSTTTSILALQSLLLSKEFSLASVYAHWFSEANVKDTKGLQVHSDQLWSYYVQVVAGGKIIGLIAQIRALQKTNVLEGVWLDDRQEYARHLAKELVVALSNDHEPLRDEQTRHYGEFASASCSAGSLPAYVTALLATHLLTRNYLTKLGAVLQNIGSTVRDRFVLETLTYLEKTFLSSCTDRNSTRNLSIQRDRVGSVATVISLLFDGQLQSTLAETLLRKSLLCNLSSRRAIVLALPQSVRNETTKRLLAMWADPIYIKHTSVTAQECLTETILLLCAYTDFQTLTLISKSSPLTQGLSGHLESTSDRIRFLGMIVGETVSAKVIVDEKKRLSFGVPDTQTEEARWWRGLIAVEDTMTDLKELTSGLVTEPGDSTIQPERTANQVDLDISEFIESSGSESSDDGEFLPMRMPDSDDEDSDDDPTLVDREKLRPPVYIRDLIKMLNEHESFKHVSLGMRSAAGLIRRKATYGSEVQDYAINLVQLFAGMRDNFDMDNFQKLRQDALRALVVSCPKVATPYLSETFFTGDYSLQQRIVMLSAIGLGCRELADAINIPSEFQALSATKALPDVIRARYESISGISDVAQEKILGPLAVEAAQSLSGPAALQVQKTTKRLTPTAKPKVVINALTPIVAEHVLFPMLGRFQLHSGKMIDKDAVSFYEASLLAYYIRTISIVYQVSTGSPAFTRLTSEFWDFLLSLRTQQDHSVLEALLFGFLIIVDSNDGRRLAVEASHQLIETQEWATTIFERVAEPKIQQLAAGCLLRIRDIVEAHQMLMMQSISSVGNIGRGRFGIAGLE